MNTSQKNTENVALKAPFSLTKEALAEFVQFLNGHYKTIIIGDDNDILKDMVIIHTNKELANSLRDTCGWETVDYDKKAGEVDEKSKRTT